MKTKLLVWICMLVTLSTFVSADITTNVTHDISDLPTVGQISLNFSLAPNETIYFNEVYNDTHIQIAYPSQITLTENQTVAEFIANYSIRFFVGYSGNYSLFEDIMAVTNSVNNNTMLVKFQYYITHPSLIESDTNETFLVFSNGGQRVEVYTYSIIEFRQAHRIDVKAPNGETINITCGDFLECPTNVTVESNNQTSIYADIVIPQGHIGGNFSSYVTLATSNNSGTIDFSIIIRNDDISNLIVYDVWEDSCYDSPEALAECYKKQAQYNSEVANALLQRIQDGNYSCEVYESENVTTRYVEVGNIDPELLKDNEKIRAEYNKLSADYTTLSSEYTQCMGAKESLSGEVEETTKGLVNDYLVKDINWQKEKALEQEELNSVVQTKLSWILGLLSFAMLFTTLGGVYLDSQWIIKDFPVKIFAGLTAIMFISWIIVVVLL